MSFIKKILFILTCAYIILLPLIPQEYMFKGLPFTDLILGMMIFVYIIELVVSVNSRKKFVQSIFSFFKDKLSLFMVVFLFIMLASTSYALDKKIALSESARFITYIFMFFIIKYELNSKKQVNNLLKCYIFTSFVLSCIGILQYFTGFALAEAFQKTNEASESIKVAATFSNPNAYGAYLILIIFPVIVLSIYEKNKSKKIGYILLSMLMIVNIMMTFSRNALLGFALGLLVLTLIYSLKLIFAFGGFGVLVLFIPSVLQRVKDITDPQQNEFRIKLWKTALMMIKDHPILGVGNGNYVTYYRTYVDHHSELKYYLYRKFPTHNSFLKVQSELGIIGIVSFLGLIVTSLLRIKKLYSTTIDKFHKPFYMGVMASIAAFLFMNISDNLFFVPKVTTYFWFVLATVEVLLNDSKKHALNKSID